MSENEKCYGCKWLVAINTTQTMCGKLYVVFVDGQCIRQEKDCFERRGDDDA